MIRKKGSPVGTLFLVHPGIRACIYFRDNVYFEVRER